MNQTATLDEYLLVASRLQARGNLSGASRSLKDALAVMSSSADAETLYHAAMMSSLLAQTLVEQGKDEEAEDEYSHSLQLAQASSSAEAPVVSVVTAYSYGQLLQRLGRAEEAEALFRLVGTFAKATNSRAAIDVALHAAGSLASSLESRGHLDAAADAYRKAVDIAVAVAREPPPGAGLFHDGGMAGVAAAGNLSFLLGTRGDLQESRDYAEIAVTLGESSGSPDSLAAARQYRAQLSRDRGRELEQAGEVAQAEEEYLRAVAAGKGSALPDGMTVAALAALSRAYLRLRVNDAEHAVCSFADCAYLGEASGTDLGGRAAAEAWRQILETTDIATLIAEKRPRQVKRLIRKRPVLITPGFAEALTTLRDLLESSDQSRAHSFDEYRVMLGRARLVGVDTAVHEAVPREPLISLWKSATQLVRERGRDLGDVSQAASLVMAWRAALAAAKQGQYGQYVRASISHDLGAALLQAPLAEASAGDPQEAVDALVAAAEVVPRPSRLAELVLIKLGHVWFRQFQLTSDEATLNQARMSWLSALDMTGPGNPRRPELLANIGTATYARFRLHGERNDLDAAIGDLNEGLEGLEAPSPLLAGLRTMAKALMDRYAELGEGTDLDRALDCLLRARSIAVDDVSLALEVAHAAQRRFVAIGDLNDCSRAEEAFGDLVARADATLETTIEALGGMAWARWQRFHTSRDGNDAQAAMDALIKALELAQAPGFARAALEANYIYYFEGWLALEGSPPTEDQWGLLTDVAHDIEALLPYLDLKESIRGELYGAAGLAYKLRYEALGGKEDLSHAVAQLERAVRFTGSAECQLLYAEALRAQLDASPNADSEQVTAAFREVGVRGLDADPRTTRDGGRRWGDWALARGAWSEAAEAYELAVLAVRRLFEAQADLQTRIAVISRQSAPQRRAFALVQGSRPEEAVVAIESSRALILEDAIGLRVDLSRLAIGHGELADRYQAIAHRLEGTIRATSDLRLADLDPGSGAREASAELERVIQEIREIPQFSTFRRELTLSDLAHAAERGLLTYIICAPGAGVALFVDQHGCVNSVPLPGLTESELNSRMDSYLNAYRGRAEEPAAWAAQLDGVGRWLWNAVMAPILSGTGDAERAILIPCGVLQLLPLHAAWTPDPETPTGRRYAIDDITITYAPSAHALLSVDDIAIGRSLTGAVVVEDPARGDRPHLRYATEEAHAVLERIPSAIHLRDDADKRSVLGALGEHPIFHFAGHAGAEAEDPLKSALFLAGDDTLTMAELLDRRLVGVRLAVLSACETAIPAQQVPDEALSIPAVLIQAGAAAAIGSQWVVSDASAVALMSRFYELMIDQQYAPEAALRSAQLWVRDSTNRELAEAYPKWFAKDAASLSPVARELWESARPYSHPQHWAPFVYVGV